MPEAGDCNKRSKSKGTDVSTSATTVDRNGDVLNSRRTVKMSDGSSTSSGDESPTETERRHQHKRSSLSRPSSKGQIHTSAFSVALSRSQMPAFPIPLTPMPMASASTSFNYHPPLAINSRTNSGRYSFESLTGNNENGNWRPGSGGQLPAANPLWYNAHQFGLNPYFSFGPYYGATPNYAEAMRQMMPAGGNMVGPNGFSESSSENSRAPSPRSRKRALSTSPGSDIMSLFNEIIRSTSNSLRPIGLHSDLNSRCSSSTSLGSFSHLSAGTISPSALYASPYQCRTPFFPPNMHNYGAKMPSVAATPGAPSAYPFPFMFPIPPFVKSDQTPNPSSGVQGSMPFPGFPGFPPPPNNNVPSTDSTPSPIKQETVKVSPVDKYCPPTKSDKSKISSLSAHHRSTSTSIGDVDKEHSNSMEDLPQTDCQWDTCTLQLEDQTKLVAHITNSHIKTQKEHVCKWADCNRERKPFKAQYMLVVHMRHHTGEKPHKCSYENCTKAYGRLENLKTHLRSHTGDKPYRCEVQGCGKSFSNASDRAKHQNRTHSNEKPYACTLSGCTKRYTDPSSLRKHIKTVHGIEAYQNKRRKRLDSEQDNANDDSVRENGLSSDVLRSKDNTDSRIDPNGSVQSSNVDSPGTYSNPTDEFCASVSPQANDSGVEMNIASDSMSCAMESLYSPELDAEIVEPLNALVAVNGDGEADDEFFPMNLPNFRPRISLKPNLPTIPSGIPFAGTLERRVAEFVGGRQNIGLGRSIPQEPVNCATVAACSSAGQHPSRAGNKFVKSPPIAKRRESTSSLASSIYSSIKSDLDATSYPAFSDCSRPESVMSSVSQTFERSRISNNQQQASLPYSYSTQPAIPRSPLLQNISPFTPNSNYVNCDLFGVGNNDLQLNTCRYQGAQTYCNDANGRHSVSNNGRQNESTFCSHSNGSSPWTSTQLSPNRAVSSSHQPNIPSDYCHQQQHQCQPYGSCSSSFGSPVNRTVNDDYSRVAYKEHHVGCLCNNADTRRASTSMNDNNFCHRCSRVRVVNGCQNVDQNPRCVCARLNETNEDFRHRLRHEYLPSDSNRNVCPTSIRNNAVNYSSCRENWRSVDEDSRQQQIRRYDNALVPSNRSPPISNVHQPQPFHQTSRMVVRADVHGCDFQMNNSLRSNAVNRPLPPAPPPTTHLIETNDVQPTDFDLSCLTFRNEPNVHPTPSLPAQIENTDDELYFERPPTVMERRMQAQSRSLYNSPNLLVNDMAMNLATFDVENRLYRSYMQSAQSNSQP